MVKTKQKGSPKKPKKTVRKLTVGIQSSTVRAMDRRVAQLRRERCGDWNRSDLVRLAINRLLGSSLCRTERELICVELRKLAEPTKIRAIEHLAKGKPHLARAAYLEAASLELEALSLLDTPDERSIQSALIEILILLKKGTGYSHLPEVPNSRGTIRSFQ